MWLFFVVFKSIFISRLNIYQGFAEKKRLIIKDLDYIDRG